MHKMYSKSQNKWIKLFSLKLNLWMLRLILEFCRLTQILSLGIKTLSLKNLITNGVGQIEGGGANWAMQRKN